MEEDKPRKEPLVCDQAFHAGMLYEVMEALYWLIRLPVDVDREFRCLGHAFKIPANTVCNGFDTEFRFPLMALPVSFKVNWVGAKLEGGATYVCIDDGPTVVLQVMQETVFTAIRCARSLQRKSE